MVMDMTFLRVKDSRKLKWVTSTPITYLLQISGKMVITIIILGGIYAKSEVRFFTPLLALGFG
jgi:hypothetical protein